MCSAIKNGGVGSILPGQEKTVCRKVLESNYESFISLIILQPLKCQCRSKWQPQFQTKQECKWNGHARYVDERRSWHQYYFKLCFNIRWESDIRNLNIFFFRFSKYQCSYGIFTVTCSFCIKCIHWSPNKANLLLNKVLIQVLI